MPKAKIPYWTVTTLFCVFYGAGGLLDIIKPGEMREALEKTGYPLYFFTMLGFCKIAGVLVLLAPGLPRLKEWAYGAITVNLIAAALHHAVMDDPLPIIVLPLAVLAVGLVSWLLRPASRKLSGPLL